MVYLNVLEEPGVSPLITVVGLLGETIVPDPDTTVHNAVSLVKAGGLAEKMVEVVLSQNTLFPLTAEVMACFAAGTVIVTSSVPFAQGPLTFHRNVYAPSFNPDTEVVLLLGSAIKGTVGPLTKVQVPDCPNNPLPAYEPCKLVFWVRL